MIGVYLHIPFCVKKCFYCDFYSIETKSSSNKNHNNERNFQINDDLANDFILALTNEIALRTNNSSGKINVDSIFLGGGTPSLLSINHLKSLFDFLYNTFRISKNTEITIECNPGTLTNEKLKAYKEIGINRLSIGVQSFVDEELNFLQRIHSPLDVEESFFLARNSGFDNISLDLIFSIPNQTSDSLMYSLQKTIDLSPDHISVYSLIFEEGTPLYKEMKKGKIKPVDDSVDSDFYKMVINFLENNGYSQYEVSNFAKDKKFCNHNLKYWHNEEYLAFGPSAHGFFNNYRYKNVRNIKQYITKLKSGELPTDSEEFQDLNKKIIDTFFLGLRSDGINLQKFKKRFNLNINKIIKNELKFLQDEGFIFLDKNKISLTSKGYQMCDSITVNLISSVEKYLDKKKLCSKPTNSSY